MVWALIVTHFATMQLADLGKPQIAGMYHSQLECEAKKSVLKLWFRENGGPVYDRRWTAACVSFDTLGPSL